MPRPGYTLIELLVVIAILASVAALAAPAIGRVIQSMTFRSEASRITEKLRTLEEEAVRTQQTITVRQSPNGSIVTTGRVVYASKMVSVHLPEHISFYPDGTSDGGHLVLHGPSGDMQVDVAWLTGDVTVGAP